VCHRKVQTAGGTGRGRRTGHQRVRWSRSVGQALPLANHRRIHTTIYGIRTFLQRPLQRTGQIINRVQRHRSVGQAISLATRRRKHTFNTGVRTLLHRPRQRASGIMWCIHGNIRRCIAIQASITGVQEILTLGGATERPRALESTGMHKLRECIGRCNRRCASELGTREHVGTLPSSTPPDKTSCCSKCTPKCTSMGTCEASETAATGAHGAGGSRCS